MNLRQLEVFQAVMRAGSISGAARLLNVSQPSVSTVLKHAESQLGMRLFERSGRHLIPSPEAERMYPEVESIFARVESLDRLTQGLKDGTSGLVTVAASPTLSTALLLEPTRVFRIAKPDVRVTLRSVPTEEVVACVARQQADFGLVYAPAGDGVADPQVIGSTGIACVLRHDHPLAAKSRVDLEELSRFEVISYRPETPLGVRLREAFLATGLALPFVVQAGCLNACALASMGLGVALIDPLVLVPGFFRDLVVRPIRPAVTSGIRVISPRGRVRSRIANQFIELVVDHARLRQEQAQREEPA